MDITRRRFLSGCAAGAVTAALPLALRRPGPDGGGHRSWPGRRCALLDLGEHCSIRESLSGYASALANLNTDWMRADARSLSPCAALIVPAALEIPPPLARLVLSRTQSGATVILESGAGFADEGGPAFRAHRDVLRDHLRLRIGAPIALWPEHPRSRAVPYVDYTWPSAAEVRDFSRVVPVLPDGDGEIIARVDGVPVALKRRSGPGMLVFLGSPLGPALWAGDAEARRWLSEVLPSPMPSHS